MILDLDHIALAVRRIKDRLPLWKLLGLKPGPEMRVEGEGVRVRFLPLGNTRLELLEPLSADTPVGRFLDRRGEGIHHICFRVASIQDAANALERHGVKIVGGIRPGADGRPVTFLHPRDTGGVLVELTEGPEPSDRTTAATGEPEPRIDR
jgi:methylmalonyl-CoA epimerase